MHEITESTTGRVLRADVAKALLQLANGVPAELVPLSALRSLERLGYVEWATEAYTRVLTAAGRQRAAELEGSKWPR